MLLIVKCRNQSFSVAPSLRRIPPPWLVALEPANSWPRLLFWRGNRTMAHKFKIGEIVGYKPPRGSKRVLHGTFTIVSFLSAIKGKPAYKIRHDQSGKALDAREDELYRL